MDCTNTSACWPNRLEQASEIQLQPFETQLLENPRRARRVGWLAHGPLRSRCPRAAPNPFLEAYAGDMPPSMGRQSHREEYRSRGTRPAPARSVHVLLCFVFSNNYSQKTKGKARKGTTPPPAARACRMCRPKINVLACPYRPWAFPWHRSSAARATASALCAGGYSLPNRKKRLSLKLECRSCPSGDGRW